VKGFFLQDFPEAEHLMENEVQELDSHAWRQMGAENLFGMVDPGHATFAPDGSVRFGESKLQEQRGIGRKYVRGLYEDTAGTQVDRIIGEYIPAFDTVINAQSGRNPGSGSTIATEISGDGAQKFLRIDWFAEIVLTFGTAVF
jgi:hypothetical protein